MARSITMGQYIPGASLIHQLNPRFKILALIMILALLFLLETLTALGVSLAAALALFALAGVPFKYLFRGLRPIMYISIFALIIYFFFTSGGVVLFRIGFLTVESDGVEQGIFIIARLVALVLFSLLVTLTTTPLSLTHGMAFFLSPLQRIGLPAEEVAMIMAVALRFIPTLMEESQRLMRAQLARGADFETGSIFKRARNLVPLIVPLFVSAFRRADDLATAMEARGFRIGAKRTRMQDDVIAFKDWITIATILALIVLVLILNF